MAKVFHPDPTTTSCSWAGSVFVRAADGSFEVPLEAVAELQSHGFTTAAPAAPAKRGKGK